MTQGRVPTTSASHTPAASEAEFGRGPSLAAGLAGWIGLCVAVTGQGLRGAKGLALSGHCEIT